MSSEELKPCPFCGGDVSFHKDEECPGCHLIQCGQCRAFFDFATGADPGNDCASVDALRAAIAPMWNTRAELAALEAECERWKYRCQYNANTAHEVAAERDTLRQQLAELRAQLLAIASAEPRRHTIEWAKAMAATGNNEAYAKWREAFDQRDKLAEVLGNVEREHELIRRMKNCEILRGRGSFGIAVMSDPLALEWQALDKELQQFVDARRTALSELTP